MTPDPCTPKLQAPDCLPMLVYLFQVLRIFWVDKSSITFQLLRHPKPLTWTGSHLNPLPFSMVPLYFFKFHHYILQFRHQTGALHFPLLNTGPLFSKIFKFSIPCNISSVKQKARSQCYLKRPSQNEWSRCQVKSQVARSKTNIPKSQHFDWLSSVLFKIFWFSRLLWFFFFL